MCIFFFMCPAAVLACFAEWLADYLRRLWLRKSCRRRRRYTLN